MKKEIVVIVVTIFVIIASSCNNGTVNPPEPVVEVASLPELVQKVNENNVKIHNFKASLDITLTYRNPDNNNIETQNAEGYIALEKPDKIRFKAEKAFATRFELVSDGNQYWIYENLKKKKLSSGSVASLKSNPGRTFLNPTDIFNAFGIQEIPSPSETHAIVWENHPTLYVLNIFHSSPGGFWLSAKMRVDKAGLRISRYQTFTIDGTLDMDAYIGQYKTVGNVKFPTYARLEWPFEEVVLELNLSEIELNTTLHPLMFKYENEENLPVEKLD